MDEIGHNQETSKIVFCPLPPPPPPPPPTKISKLFHTSYPSGSLHIVPSQSTSPHHALGPNHPTTQPFSLATAPPPPHTHTRTHTHTHTLSHIHRAGRSEQSPTPASRSRRWGLSHSQIKGLWPKSLSGQCVKSAADENSTVFSQSPTEPVFPVQSLPTDD